MNPFDPCDLVNGWYYRAWRGVTGQWVAECKRTPFQYPGGVDHYAEALREEGDLFFEFGDTKEDAIARLKASVRDEAIN